MVLQPAMPQAYASCLESGNRAGGITCNMQILSDKDTC